MKIVMLASEMAPVASSGAMGVAISRLAAGLRAAGHEVLVILPLYRSAREELRIKRTRQKFSVPVGPAMMGCEMFSATAPCGTPLLLVGRDEFFDRSGLYGNESGDYQDNAARFVFFVKAALQAVKKMSGPPDIVHAHGWQAALAGVFNREDSCGAPIVLTPHGLEFQGNFWSYDFALTNLPGRYFSTAGLEFYGSMNFLKAGLLFSDAVILPDERFAALAATPAEGCGLESVFREIAGRVWGIPDGVALDGWNPAEDSSISSTFDADTLVRRTANRSALGKRFGFHPESPVFAVLSAMTAGTGALFPAMDRLVPSGASFVMLGPPEDARRMEYEVAKRHHAAGFAAIEDMTDNDAREVLAGCDYILVPTALRHAQPWLQRALRYGAIPVARRCHGLPQFVCESGPNANGFLFGADSTEALLGGCRKALHACARPAPRETRMQSSVTVSTRDPAAAHKELYKSLP
jgi:starch synthase